MALTGWDSTKKIQLTIPAQGTTLTDFPVLVNLTSSSGISGFDSTIVFSELGINSKKIAVEIGDTDTQCYIEIERWDDVNVTAQLWVKATLSSTESTVLNLYYDVLQADNTSFVGDTGSVAAQSVWDANFVAVYHMAQDPSGVAPQILDSTVNANAGTTAGTMTVDDLVDGAVGKALDLDGVDDYVEIASSTSLDIAANITLETNFYRRDTGDQGQLFKGSLASTQGVYSIVENVGDVTFRLNGSVTEDSGQVTATGLGIDTWNYLAAVYDGSTQSIFKDGALVKADPEALTISTDTNPLYIGTYYDTNNVFNGLVSEVRISNVARATDWITTTAQSNTDSLVEFTSFPIEINSAFGLDSKLYLPMTVSGNFGLFTRAVMDSAKPDVAIAASFGLTTRYTLENRLNAGIEGSFGLSCEIELKPRGTVNVASAFGVSTVINLISEKVVVIDGGFGLLVSTSIVTTRAISTSGVFGFGSKLEFMSGNGIIAVEGSFGLSIHTGIASGKGLAIESGFGLYTNIYSESDSICSLSSSLSGRWS